ncbi:hypothetical protein BH24ACT3_BH24ACT3_05810 [soil metagenome]
MSPTAPEERLTAELEARIRAHPEWYHTLELAPGLVTPGWFDTRGVLDRLPLPNDLRGLRCLDIGTFDGFWAFAMERRGAAEVVAIDLLEPERWDWPIGSQPETREAIGRRKAHGEGFLIATEVLGSSVKRHDMSVHDLDPDAVGHFDFVYLGSLLLHLRDPIAALARVRSVCSGRLLFVDAVDAGLTLRHPRRSVAALDGVGRPWWWRPNQAGLVRMVEAGGFEVVGRPQRVRVPAVGGQRRPGPRAAGGMLRSPAGRAALVHTHLGDPHAAVLARPI